MGLGSGTSEDIDHAMRVLHGAVLSLAEEMRLRMIEVTDELSATRQTIGALQARVDALEGTQRSVATDVGRVARVLDEESAGVLNRIRVELDLIQGELAQTRARIADTELSMMDALLTTRAKTGGG